MKSLHILYKNGLLLLAFVLVLASCNNANKDSKEEQTNETNISSAKGKALTINGTVKSPPKEGIVTLQKLINKKYSTVDSTALTDGKFVFEVKVSEPEFYRVVLFNKQSVFMVVTDKDLEIVADATIPEIPYTVKGSKDMEYFREVNRVVNQLRQDSRKLNGQYMLAEKEKTGEAEKIYDQLIELQKNGITKIKGIIDTIQPSISALYAANILNPDEEFAYLKKLSDNLSKKYPNSRYVKRNAEFLKSIEKLTIGQPAPNITLKSPEGNDVSLSSLKGKLVLIDFWASWCKPCRMENPNVVKVYNEYKNKGFEIYGVSLDKFKDQWTKAIEKDGLPWLHVLDAQSLASAEYKVSAIPMTYLIDKEGNILAKNLRGKALRTRVSKELD
ncbi:hypothetical protein BKI52_21880 [marine bacterium AO1-C]|nr:hypothetical protein BKI52_21880 [marine bacterium AO1-C]